MLGIRLRELRNEKEITQSELGKILNLSQRSISQYELGIRFPDEVVLNLIADFFDVSLDYLFGRTNIKNIYKEWYRLMIFNYWFISFFIKGNFLRMKYKTSILLVFLF